MEIEARLKKMIGDQFELVSFAQDYLQLHFGSSKFTIYVWPEVWIDKEKYLKENSLYQNMLCSLIAKKIKDISYKDESYLTIYIEDRKNYIHVCLDPYESDVYDIAIFEDMEDEAFIVFN